MKLYQGGNLEELPPHIFALAESCYGHMTRHLQNQCCIIRSESLPLSAPRLPSRLKDGSNAAFFLSGESGAGKTESAKLILRYLAAVSSEMSQQRTERLILESNPILEGTSWTSHRDVDPSGAPGCI